MKTVGIIGALLMALQGWAQTPLFIPDTLGGPNYNLTMHRDSVQFFPSGKSSHTYAFNTYAYLGPTLIFHQGTPITITVNNQIGDTTTVHWHGIHLPAVQDGGPHTVIAPNASWQPQFTVMDHAATYWYHPHTHMKTAEQAIKGALGLILVRDAQEAALNLPRTYGVDDFPIIVQCQQYDANNQAMPLGMEDSTLLVNGARANNGYSVYANFPAQVVRLRLLNGSGERAFQFGFSGNTPFYQIASDGGLLNAPYLTNRLRLAPGERAEILLNLSGMNGQSLYLMSYASELAMGIQGGPTMPMPSGPPMNSPLNGIDFNILKIQVGTTSASPVTVIPTSLVNNVPYPASQASIERTIRFTADSAMVMDGPFYFNDSTFDMMRIDYKIPLNSTEIWKLVNETMVAHPFHIHDVQFYVLDRNGNPPGPEEAGRKDVILVPPGDSVRFITRFEDFVDTLVPYMYHCHILMHEDDGMMGQFLVTPALSTDIATLSKDEATWLVYPNPAREQVTVRLTNNTGPAEIKLYDVLGQECYASRISNGEQTIQLSAYRKGIYNMVLHQNGQLYCRKIMIE